MNAQNKRRKLEFNIFYFFCKVKRKKKSKKVKNALSFFKLIFIWPILLIFTVNRKTVSIPLYPGAHVKLYPICDFGLQVADYGSSDPLVYIRLHRLHMLWSPSTISSDDGTPYLRGVKGFWDLGILENVNFEFWDKLIEYHKQIYFLKTIFLWLLSTRHPNKNIFSSPPQNPSITFFLLWEEFGVEERKKKQETEVRVTEKWGKERGQGGET